LHLWLDVIDVKGAFLLGDFEDNVTIYMEIPQGFKQWYRTNEVWLLLQTIYGTKQAAIVFWRLVNKVMKNMNFTRSTTDPCLFYKWTDEGLVVWLIWVDDCLCIGPEKACKQAVADMKSRFDCDDVGELAEYVGCKVTHNKVARTIKFTQPVMIQSFLDEFDIADDMRKPPNTPGEPGTVLTPVQPVDYAPEKVQRYYRRGVRKLLHVMRWCRPEIYNSVRELSRSMKGASYLHVKALHRDMAYVCNTPKRGYFLNPKDKWDGNPNSYNLRMSGEADADFAKDPLTRRSVSSNVARLEEVPVIVKNVMQKLVAISVTESELYSGVTCAQNMLYLWRLYRSMGISIELPMILKIDNKGTVDTANNWSCGG